MIAEALHMLQLTANETYGEQISHLHHAIQTYYHLRNEDIEIRVAGFWHDIGHSYILQADRYEAMRDAKGNILGIVDHDDLGMKLFQGTLPDRVCRLISMHTRAKRYQATKSKLSEASRMTYELEGGDMSAEQRAEFEQDPLFRDALILRGGDDAGKDPDLDIAYELWLLRAIDDTFRVALA